MEQILAILRYFPLGRVAGTAVPISRSDIVAIAEKHNVSITLEELKGENLQIEAEKMREETMNSRIEEISQSVITIVSTDEIAVGKAIKDLIKKYRAPRTVYGTWGSNQRGNQIISGICDEDDGWR